MTDIQSFENLWEMAESIADKKYKEQPTADLVKEAAAMLNAYSDTNTIDSQEVAASLKHRYLGEILFLITALSIRDNINVYAALQDILKLNQIG